MIPDLTTAEFAQRILELQEFQVEKDFMSPMRGAYIISTISSIAYIILRSSVFVSAVIGFSALALGLIARKILERYTCLSHLDQRAIVLERKMAWLLPALFILSIASSFLLPRLSIAATACCGMYAGMTWNARRVVTLTRDTN